MTKEGIKAVRFCCGYNTNLRVKLDWDLRYETPHEEKIRSFLEANLLGVFGSNIYDRLGICFNPQPGKDVEDLEKLYAFLRHEARAVCLGEAEEEAL